MHSFLPFFTRGSGSSPDPYPVGFFCLYGKYSMLVVEKSHEISLSQILMSKKHNQNNMRGGCNHMLFIPV
jgi:hypothetical protein